MDLYKLPHIDLRLLVVFDEIRKQRSLTLAAESLGVTQPTISKSLQRLRHELGDVLFVRTQQGMEPTPRARALEGPVAEVLRTFQEQIVGAQAFDPACSDQIFSIHASDLGLSVLLPALAQELSRRAPQTRIAAVTGSKRDVIEGLESGDVDVSIGAFSNLDEAGLYQQRLYVEQYTCLVRDGHPLLSIPIFGTREFREQTHIMISTGRSGHAHARAEVALIREIAPAHVAMRVPSFLLGALLLRKSDHVLTIPKAAATTLAPEFNLRLLPCPIDLPEFTIYQYWHERFAHDPAGSWLRSLVHEMFGAANPANA